MPFRIVIRLDKDTYRIIVENSMNLENWTLFQSKDWDTIKCQRDQFIRLFGVSDIPLLDPND